MGIYAVVNIGTLYALKILSIYYAFLYGADINEKDSS
jgi:hypothetical protein